MSIPARRPPAECDGMSYDESRVVQRLAESGVSVDDSVARVLAPHAARTPSVVSALDTEPGDKEP